jgi:hypothetical protein
VLRRLKPFDACADASDCTAVGFYLHVGKHALAEHWDGTAWALETVPDLPGGRSAYLLSVACPSATSCVAVGTKGSPNHSNTLVEVWDGTVWRVQDSPNPQGRFADPWLEDVSCASTTSCLAVGFFGGNGKYIFQALAERWDGSAWSLMKPHPPGRPHLSFLDGVACVSGLTCVAVGFYGSLNGPRLTLAERYLG